MTCRRFDMHWRDALYNAVTQMPGGINAAAAYLSQRRMRAITGESLRKKLAGLPGESISLEMAEMLTDWMRELSAGQDVATVWIQSLAAQFGLTMDHVPDAPAGGWACEVEAIQAKVMSMAAIAGRMSGLAVDTLQDRHVTAAERDAFIAISREMRTMAHRMERNVRRAEQADRARRPRGGTR